MADFVHLHVHSEFSLLDGLVKIPALLSKTAEYGMKAVSLTDHGALYGAFKFYLKCIDSGIKPIIGMEAYVAKRSRFDKQTNIDNDRFHLVLLAKNYQGYKNLLKLTTAAHLEGFYYKPRIDDELLEKYGQDLIVLSGCLEGEIPCLLRQNEPEKAELKAKKYLSLFGADNFYLELQHHPKITDQYKVNKELIGLSRKLGIPIVATNDVHYVDKEDAQAHEILLCVQTQRTILEKNRPLSMIDSPDFYLRSPEEMQGLFVQYPEAIENTLTIAQMCNISIPYGDWILPHFPVPKGETAETYLRKVTFERLKLRFEKAPPEILQRLNYELDVICKKGFATYFLIVSDFVNWAKQQGIRVGPGRGSVGGSLVAFILRITSLNPLEHGLPFERFLNPDRPSPPDIDLDFADDRRDEVIAYVTKQYGEEKVAQIITFGTMEARAAIRDTGRALGMPYSQPDRIAKMIPVGFQGFAMTIERALKQSSDLASAYNTEEDTRRLLNLAKKLEGIARHSSTHAAGVVIADRNLSEYTPLQREVKGNRIITQYDMYSLDLNAAPDGRAIGLLKMDFLGLRNLTILQNAINFVRVNRKEEIDLSSIPLNDKKTYELIQSGETTGIFQLESAGMRRLAQNLKPTKFSDISAMVALFRPGPMDWIPDFIASKENPKKIHYPHPDLRPILSETYGIAVYQEQCMQIANQMAGYTMAEADGLRKAIGKKKPELMRKESAKFIKGCLKKGYSKSVSEKIFSLIEQFVGYGFNKAHSAAYALIAYQTAYMKANFPAEYMTAVLSAESKASSGPIHEEKVSQAVEECKRMGIILLPPEINQSGVDFEIIKDPQLNVTKISFGLSAIKNVGSAAIGSILKARESGPFKSLSDFCYRVDTSKVNKKVLESLIKIGAMDSFGKRSSMLSALSEILSQAQKSRKKELDGQFSLFDNADSDHIQKEKLPEMEEFSQRELLAFEKQLFGFYLTAHPLAPLLNKLATKVTYSLKDVDPAIKKPIVVGGIITRVRKIMTKNGNNEMAFVKIEDSTGSCDLVVFPTIYAKTKHLWNLDQVILASGKIDTRNDRINLLVDKVSLLT